MYLLFTAGVVFPCCVTVELVHRLVRTELRHILRHGSRNIECTSVSANIPKKKLEKNENFEMFENPLKQKKQTKNLK